jgi:hypothetical protein
MTPIWVWLLWNDGQPTGRRAPDTCKRSVANAVISLNQITPECLKRYRMELFGIRRHGERIDDRLCNAWRVDLRCGASILETEVILAPTAS